MKILYPWLKEFAAVNASPDELASRLALSGTNIAGIEAGPHGAVIDAEITSNRPDCLSHLGIARETSAIYKLPLKQTPPQPTESASAGTATDAAKVIIQNPELCGRFTARVIRGVKIQPSPAWLKERLEACGIASISNVVDISNYVMLELGNPLHTYDYDKVRGHSIIVRAAVKGEKARTLDGLERTVEPGTGVITDGDGSRIIGIAGVMGGAETEISFSTTNVLIECAWFDPIAIRRSARAHKLHTEASTRFGRGADPEMAEVASRRCAELILQLAGGELLQGLVDIYPGKRPPEKIQLTRAEFLRVMGADVTDHEIESILTSLGFAPVRIDKTRDSANSTLAAWECTSPSWRAEVTREIDLVEEVARIYGLDKFPPRLPIARQGAARLPHYEAESRFRERLIGLGYQEILTIPHVAEERDAIFRSNDAPLARLANPLSEDAGMLRSNAAVSMAAAIEWNLNHSQRDVRLFEIGHHYHLAGDQPVETRVLSIGATGSARQKGLYDTARDYTFEDLKGDLDNLAVLAAPLNWRTSSIDWLHPAKRANVLFNDQLLGVAGQLSRRVAEKLKLRQEVFIAEILLGPLYDAYYAAKNSRRYQPIPRFPAVERDFSLLLSDGTHFSAVAKSIQALQIEEIVSIEAADLFRGKNVPAGKYSLLIKVFLQSREATLTDAQISDISGRIVSALEKDVSAQLRSA
jgi:phenylalanyl-tRNA synthetase beta chain